MAEYIGVFCISGMLCCVFGYPCCPDRQNDNQIVYHKNCTLTKGSYQYLEFDELTNLQECPICLEFDPIDDLCMLNSCKHIFHYSCINSWATYTVGTSAAEPYSRTRHFAETKKYRKPRCPCCRSIISVQSN